MPRKRCNLPVKVRSGELSVHPGSKDPVCGATHKAKWIEKTLYKGGLQTRRPYHQGTHRAS